jgi:hypothetical protein
LQKYDIFTRNEWYIIIVDTYVISEETFYAED